MIALRIVSDSNWAAEVKKLIVLRPVQKGVPESKEMPSVELGAQQGGLPLLVALCLQCLFKWPTFSKATLQK
jgi:hypothetical protein